MNILALDLGTRTGWALRLRGTIAAGPPRIESGVQVFDVKRGESPGMRYLRFNHWLEEIDRAGRSVEIIVYEQTHQRGGAATEVAAGFATRVQEFCARKGIEHSAVHSATLKKFTTGSGRGDKSGMAMAAAAKGWIVSTTRADDNEVDAICLLHFALAEIVPGPGE